MDFCCEVILKLKSSIIMVLSQNHTCAGFFLKIKILFNKPWNEKFYIQTIENNSE